MRRSTGDRHAAELVDDVLATVLTMPQRRWWSLWLTPPARLVPVIVLTALLMGAIVGIALVAGARLFQRDPTDVVTEGGFVEPFIGLPPEGAVSSAPETDELVLSLEARVHSLDMDVHMMWVYADGRLIWKRNLDGVGPKNRGFGATEPTLAVIEQRLTPEGVELLRSTALSSGLFVHDRVGYGNTQGSVGVLWGRFKVHDGQRLVEIYLENPIGGRRYPEVAADMGAQIERLVAGAPPGTETREEVGKTLTPDEARALEHLTERLVGPASWLPRSAWRDQRVGGYVPNRFAICLQSQGRAAARNEDLLPLATKDLLRARAIRMEDRDDSGCIYQVTTEDARAIAVTLDNARLRRGGPPVLSYQIPDGPGQEGQVDFVAILPNGERVTYGG